MCTILEQVGARTLIVTRQVIDDANWRRARVSKSIELRRKKWGRETCFLTKERTNRIKQLSEPPKIGRRILAQGIRVAFRNSTIKFIKEMTFCHSRKFLDCIAWVSFPAQFWHCLDCLLCQLAAIPWCEQNSKRHYWRNLSEKVFLW